MSDRNKISDQNAPIQYNPKTDSCKVLSLLLSVFIPVILPVTVHSVHSNTLRDAQKSCIRMISRRNSRVFCELCSQKTPRGTLPVNSNERTTMLLWQSFLISLWSYLIYFYPASFIRSSTHSSSDKTEVFRQIS